MLASRFWKETNKIFNTEQTPHDPWNAVLMMGVTALGTQVAFGHVRERRKEPHNDGLYFVLLTAEAASDDPLRQRMIDIMSNPGVIDQDGRLTLLVVQKNGTMVPDAKPDVVSLEIADSIRLSYNGAPVHSYGTDASLLSEIDQYGIEAVARRAAALQHAMTHTVLAEDGIR